MRLAACSNTPAPTVLLADYAEKPEEALKHLEIATLSVRSQTDKI